jgi:regulatory protein
MTMVPRGPRSGGAGAPAARRTGAAPLPATPAGAKTAAVRLLARREYSRAELTQRLLRKGLPREIVDRALDDLVAAGYLSDQRVADATVAQKSGRYGKRAIVYALKEKGIGAAEMEVALAPLAHTDEFADAQALWQQRFGTPPASDREKARHVRFLQSRGFALTIALRVLRSAGSPAGEDDA